MSETKKIRVKSAEAADPRMVVVLESTDGGTFPPCTQVAAVLTNPQSGGSFSGRGSTVTNGMEKEVRVEVSLADPNFHSGQTLDYDLDVLFSEDNRNWIPVPDRDVEGHTGRITPP